jgi:hypothetical protein
MLCGVNMSGITVVTLQLNRGVFTGDVAMDDSYLYITSLPYTLGPNADTGTTPTDNYTSVVPQMTSNTSPSPFKIIATGELTPAWYAFNTDQSGWTTDIIESPEISVSCGTRIAPNVILITTLPYTPNAMNINLTIYGSYVENGVDYLKVITTFDNLIGETDGTSKVYELLVTSDTLYETFTFQITYFSTDNSSNPGFKNIQIYTTLR